jgi:hypothetical protein
MHFESAGVWRGNLSIGMHLRLACYQPESQSVLSVRRASPRGLPRLLRGEGRRPQTQVPLREAAAGPVGDYSDAKHRAPARSLVDIWLSTGLYSPRFHSAAVGRQP